MSFIVSGGHSQKSGSEFFAKSSRFSGLVRAYLVGNYRYLLMSKGDLSEERSFFLSQCAYKVLLHLGVYQSFWQRSDYDDLENRCYDVLNVMKEYPYFSFLTGDQKTESEIVHFLAQGVFQIRREPMGQIDQFAFQQLLDDTMKNGGFNLEHIQYANLLSDSCSDHATLGSSSIHSLESSSVSTSPSFDDDDFSRSLSPSFDDFSRSSAASFDDFSRSSSVSFDDFPRSSSRSSFDSYSDASSEF